MVGILWLALASVATGSGRARAETPFVDTGALVRHAGGGPPPIVFWHDALSADVPFEFRHGNLSKPLSAIEPLLRAKRPVKVMAGFDGASGHVRTAAVQAAVRGETGMVLASGRYDTASSYFDAKGQKVAFGYDWDNEQLFLRWTPAPDLLVKTLVGRDVVRDSLEPQYGLDVTLWDRKFWGVEAEWKAPGAGFDAVALRFTGEDLDGEADNYSLREAGSTRIAVRGLRNQAKTRLSARFRALGMKWTAGTGLGFENVKGRNYLPSDGPEVVASIRFPGVQTWKGDVGLDTEKDFSEDAKLRAGLRLDRVQASADMLNDRPDTTNAFAAFYNVTPQELYETYYDDMDQGGGGTVAETHLSGRLSYRQEFLGDRLSLTGDLERLVRSADFTERYRALTGPLAGTQVWAGNPKIRPERHHRAKLALAFEEKTWSFSAGARVDKVRDFITVDRARGQTGIRLSNEAAIYRNVDATLVDLEVDAAWAPLPGWSVQALARHTRGTNDTDRRPLYQIPPFEANLGIDFQDEVTADLAWNVGGVLRFVGRQDRVDDDDSTGLGMDTGGKAGAFATLDLYAGMRLNDRFSLRASIDNVLDKHYHEHLTGQFAHGLRNTVINAPGRTFALRLQGTF